MAMQPLYWKDICERSTVVVGIDPGASGGIACLCENEMFALKMPEERDACRCLYNLIDKWSMYAIDIYVEKVFIRRNQASMVNYVSRYGSLIGSIFANPCERTNIYEIPPTEWQEHYPELFPDSVKTKKGTPRAEALEIRKQRRAEIKSLSREVASSLYPELKPLMKLKNSDGVSDAILLCLFGAHKTTGRI
jgi:hypothetical protein